MRVRPILGVVAATGAWLLALELGLQLLIYLPGKIPDRFETYFLTGASTETRLRRVLTGEDEEIPLRAGLVRSGWNDEETLREVSPLEAEIGIYGMSFTRDIAEALREALPETAIRSIAGPASPPAHVYQSFLHDPARSSLGVAVLGITSIERTHAMTTDTMGGAVLTPATFPRYELRAGELVEHPPAISSFRELQEAMVEPGLWSDHLAALRDHDLYFHPLFYESSWVEKLVLGRLVLAAAQSQRTIAIRRQIHGSRGFRDDTVLGREALETTRALLLDFARVARERSQIPVVLLIGRTGYADHLDRAFAGTLEAAGIPFVSTHRLCASSDTRCLAKDLYHFSDEANRLIAAALVERIRTSR